MGNKSGREKWLWRWSVVVGGPLERECRGSKCVGQVRQCDRVVNPRGVKFPQSSESCGAASLLKSVSEKTEMTGGGEVATSVPGSDPDGDVMY